MNNIDETYSCACGSRVQMKDWYSHMNSSIHKTHKEINSTLCSNETDQIKKDICKERTDEAGDIVLYTSMKPYEKTTFRETVIHIITILNIKSREDLSLFLKKKQISRIQFYRIVESYIPHKWDSVKSPKDSVSYWVQKNIKGYKICKK
jgi:glycerol-3-phosphate O-acyltransferase